MNEPTKASFIHKQTGLNAAVGATRDVPAATNIITHLENLSEALALMDMRLNALRDKLSYIGVPPLQPKPEPVPVKESGLFIGSPVANRLNNLAERVNATVNEIDVMIRNADLPEV